MTAENDELHSMSASAMPHSVDPTSGTYTTSDRSLIDKPFQHIGALLVLKEPIKSASSANTLGASQGDDKSFIGGAHGPIRGGSANFFGHVPSHGPPRGTSSQNMSFSGARMGDSSGSIIEEETQERRITESRTEEVRTVRRILRSRSRHQTEPQTFEETVWYRTDSGTQAGTAYKTGAPSQPVVPTIPGEQESLFAHSTVSEPGKVVEESKVMVRTAVDERAPSDVRSERALSTSYASSQYSVGEVPSTDQMHPVEGSTSGPGDAASVVSVISTRPSTVSIGEVGAFFDRTESAADQAKALSTSSSLYSLATEEQGLAAQTFWKPFGTSSSQAPLQESSGFESKAASSVSEKSFPAFSVESTISDYKTGSMAEEMSLKDQPVDLDAGYPGPSPSSMERVGQGGVTGTDEGETAVKSKEPDVEEKHVVAEVVLPAPETKKEDEGGRGMDSEVPSVLITSTGKSATQDGVSQDFTEVTHGEHVEEASSGFGGAALTLQADAREKVAETSKDEKELDEGALKEAPSETLEQVSGAGEIPSSQDIKQPSLVPLTSEVTSLQVVEEEETTKRAQEVEVEISVSSTEVQGERHEPSETTQEPQSQAPSTEAAVSSADIEVVLVSPKPTVPEEEDRLVFLPVKLVTTLTFLRTQPAR